MVSRTKAIGAIGGLYRGLLPERIRTSKMATKLKRNLPHDWIYDSGYFSTIVEVPAIRSAPRIANSIVDDFKPTSVVDVGCGTGALLEILRNRGCEVFGLEYSDAALQYCREKHLAVAKFDLERDIFAANRIFDVAISLEVAEHLPEECADAFVSLLAGLSSTHVFTAAHPGQGGTDHVNEQPPSYWIAKFDRYGFQHAERLSTSWRESWAAGGEVESWYYQNLMIFQRRTPMKSRPT